MIPTPILALVAALAATAAYCLHPDATTRYIVEGAWVGFLALVNPADVLPRRQPAAPEATDLRDTADKGATP